jgi:hypothetical protein
MALLKANTGIGITNPSAALHVIGDGIFVGVVSATTFYGNLGGGVQGSVPYQSGISTTAFLSPGAAGQVLVTGGSGQNPYWLSPSSLAGSFTGLTIRDEGSIVGSAASVSSLNFVGSNIVATASGVGATITIADNLVGTALSISGISTFTNGPVFIGSGTSTGTASQKLQVTGGAYVSGSLGIGSTAPGVELTVIGSIQAGSATTYTTVGGDSGRNIEIGVGSTTLDTYLDFGGSSTYTDYATRLIRNSGDNGPFIIVNRGTGALRLNSQDTGPIEFYTNNSVRHRINSDGIFLVGAGTSTGTASQRLQVTGGAYVSGNLGIASINPTSKLTVTGDVLVSGVVTATQFVGSFTGNVTTANYATLAGVATIAGYASTAGIATYARTAGIATYANVSGIATYASSAGIATYANIAGIATYATSSGIATIAGYASTAGIATYAPNAGIATYAPNAGIATYAPNAGIATNLKGGIAGNVPYQSATDATTFVSNGTSGQILLFNGSIPYWGNASAAAGAFSGITIRDEGTVVGSAASILSINFVGPNVVATGSGAGATITLSNDAQYLTGTAPGSVISQSSGLTVTGNLSISGNLSVGGTSAILNATTLQIKDKDIILGITTNALNQDVSTDNTANHGGIAIASTEGNPLFNINAGVGTDDIPSTYKQIMWLKSGTLTGLNTDAWLFNYGVGVGTDQVPNGVRLAAGNVQFTQNDLSSVRNIYSTGVITATQFVGSFSGNAATATYATSAGIATYANIAGIATYANRAGIATYANTAGIATYSNTAGIATYANSSGIATYSNTSGFSTFSGYSNTSGFSTFSGYSNTSGFSTFSGYSNTSGFSTFSGYSNTSGIATYATNAGIATNIKGGVAGNVPYQSATDATTFVTNGTVGQVLIFNGSVPVWGSASAASGAFSGISVLDEGTIVGSALSVSSLNFVGGNIVATASGVGATITIASNLVGTALSISGISTLGITSTTNLTTQQLNVSGLSTFAGITTYTASLFGTTASFTGVVTASSFRGNASSATYSTTAGIATYSNTSGFSTFSGYSNTSGFSTFSGYSNTSGFSTFSGYSNTSGIATNVIGGIASVTSLNVSGISTLGTVQISSGIVTATAGVVTYYGDGSKLTGISASGGISSISISANTTNQNQFLTYAIGTGNTTGLGVTTTGLVFNPSTTRLGIGTTNPTSALTITGGDINLNDGGTYSTAFLTITPTANRFISLPDATGTVALVAGSSGQVTYNSAGIQSGSSAFTFDGSNVTLTGRLSVSGITTLGITSATNLTTQQLQVTGISTFTNGPVFIGSGTSTGTASQRLQVTGGAYISTSTGIGTTNPTQLLHVQGNVRIAGGLYDSNNNVGTAGSVLSSTGSGLSWIAAGSGAGGISSVSISTSSATQSQFLTFVAGTGTTTGFGVSTTGLVFNPSTGNLGIGTTNPLQKAHILGSLLVAAGSSTGQHITQKAYELNNGTLSWEGTAGQLFSITNNLTSGSIFSVNDVSGIPSIDVDANGTVSMVSYGGSVGIGTTLATQRLHVQGNVRIAGALYDSNNNVGAANSILISTGAGISWTSSVASSGGISSVSISTNTTNQNQFLTFVTGTGSTTGFGVSTTGLVFNPSTGNLGIGTTNPLFKADIAGDARVTSTNKMRFGGTTSTTNFYIQYNSTTNSLDFVAG